MKSREIAIDFRIGIHSRPAALLVKKCREYPGHAITLRHGEKQARCDSLIGLITLGAVEGSVISIQVEGPGEEAVLEEMCAFFIEKVAGEGCHD
jgi:phosphocarrier protein